MEGAKCVSGAEVLPPQRTISWMRLDQLEQRRNNWQILPWNSVFQAQIHIHLFESGSRSPMHLMSDAFTPPNTFSGVGGIADIVSTAYIFVVRQASTLFRQCRQIILPHNEMHLI